MMDATFYFVGDRVRHTGRDEMGTVTNVTDKEVHVTFDKPAPSGKPSVGIYDGLWFRLHPRWLSVVERADG